MAHDPQKLRQQFVEAGCRRAAQARRNEIRVQNDRAIRTDLDDPCKTDEIVTGEIVAGFEEFQAKTANIDGRHEIRLDIGVGDLIAGGGEAHIVRIVASAGGHIRLARLPGRQGEIDNGVLDAFVEIERRRQVGIFRRFEGRSIGKNAAQVRQGELTYRQRAAVNADFGDAPRIRREVACGVAHQAFGPAVGLLKMLNAKKHALAPGNTVLMSHRGCLPPLHRP